MQKILAQLNQTSAGCCLATVVATSGSTFRGPGARVILTEQGEILGALSGGCVEADILEVARAIQADGRPRLSLYDATGEDDLIWGLGLGCEGIVEVLVEPTGPGGAATWLPRVAAELEQGRPCALAVRLDGPEPGRQRMLVAADGSRQGSLGDPGLDAAVARDGLTLLAAPRAGTLHYRLDAAGGEGARAGEPEAGSAAGPAEGRSGYQGGGPPGSGRGAGDDPSQLLGRAAEPAAATGPGMARVYLESFLPPPRLVLFGAGPDALPVVELAARMGYAVVVADWRSEYLVPRRFPMAHLLVRIHPDQPLAALDLRPTDFTVIMTHAYLRDRAILAGLLAVGPRHIGLMGPYKRAARLLDEIAAGGVSLPDWLEERLGSPTGLDIGGEEPEELAMSIVAELQAVRYGRPGGRLRGRRDPLHQRGLADLAPPEPGS